MYGEKRNGAGGSKGSGERDGGGSSGRPGEHKGVAAAMDRESATEVAAARGHAGGMRQVELLHA